MADNAYDNHNDMTGIPMNRPRLSVPPDPHEETEDVPEEWDLQEARAQNDMNLKSIFEGIFAKYGQDFTEVGDEIDLETGDIVVDNGHLLGLEEEGRGNQNQAWGSEEGESENEEFPGSPHEGGAEEDVDANTKGVVFEDPVDQTNGSCDPSQPTSNPPVVGDEHLKSRDSALTSTTDNPKTRSVPELQDMKVSEEGFGPTDPVWKVPELPRRISTPKTESRVSKVAVTPRLPYLNRQRSPPGSGSLWSLPRPRRPRTETKPKLTPSKTRPRAKRKYHSSPVAPEALDWSFADIAEGDESDDPLQEYEPSPTPSRKQKIRGKRMRMTTQTDSDLHSRFQGDRGLSGPTESTTPEDQSAKITATATVTTSNTDFTEQSHVEQGETQETVANPIDSPCDVSAHLPAMQAAAPASSPIPVSPSVPLPSVELSSSPPRCRRVSPDETRIIVRMRYVERNIWKKILPFLPGRSPNFFNYWRHFHWTKPRANPPKLHTPWSQNELDILDQLQHREGLSWEDMQHELPNRSKAAIEFELLRLWAGDEVWYGEGNNTLRSDNTLHSSEGLDSSPRSQINESKNTVDTPISPVTHLNTPSVSQTPTVYLISDEEDLEDAPTPDDEENVEDVPTPDDDEKDVEDAFTPIVDAEGVADTEAPNDQEEEKVAGLPSTPQHRRMPVFHTPNTKDRDLIDITWTMPGSRDSRRARRMLDYR
ncbi:uncharacterized protein N7469_009078 [Penicillium citrinum]|uniref:Myb-like DNA-binding domain protein n=2 Tax=Penicillium TaxID=5073 RepID=A0A9W9NN86_PENCI|nr:uncharacterized protein N7469_009078 [Penicillium citrinum]KAJ5222838.1 hypothetical protein N7469_009078 [Penicillium citrinum]KAJ5581001.1 hypothetical protein N7450_007302 [Penicillium hetheringtonii]